VRAKVLGRVGGQVRGDQAAQLTRQRPGRRPAAGGTAGLAQQPLCPRRCLRKVIGRGERAVEVPGLQGCPGLRGGGSGSTLRLVRAGRYACRAGWGGGPGVLLLPTQVAGVLSVRVLGGYARRGDRGVVRQGKGVRAARSWRLIGDVLGCPGGRGRGPVPGSLARLLQGGQLPRGGRG
jgi:hypothetical protein